MGVLFGLSMANSPALAHGAATLYDADPKHLWNRLHEALFVRVAPDGVRHGEAALDILYWDTTTHLLTAPSQAPALAVLDEFIRVKGEKQIGDPLRRIFLQRDLWALFDWSARRPERADASADDAQARLQLQKRLAVIIKRLALPAKDVERLPDNLPADGPRVSDGWILVGRTDGKPTALEHTTDFGGRSVFQVWVKLPDGKTEQYLKELREFAPALIYSAERLPGMSNLGGRQTLSVNPDVPQFPAGTQWALVRRLCVIDDAGKILATPVAESMQMRRYIAIPERREGFDALVKAQSVAEWQIDRARLPALRAVQADDRDLPFVHFRSIGVDLFENTTADNWNLHGGRIFQLTLRTCMQCHQARGVLSVNSYASFGASAHSLEPSTPEREEATTIAWKSRQYDWGLLNGLGKQ